MYIGIVARPRAGVFFGGKALKQLLIPHQLKIGLRESIETMSMFRKHAFFRGFQDSDAFSAKTDPVIPRHCQASLWVIVAETIAAGCHDPSGCFTRICVDSTMHFDLALVHDDFNQAEIFATAPA